MRILLTNDDGIYAEGIFAAYQQLKKIANVTVVAPDSERSSVGHGITLAHPIYCGKIKRKGQFFGYSISGTPADCIKFGIHTVMKRKPDLVVSGINLGPNDGCSVFYSGTVAGAREGALLGLPSMAVSLATFMNPSFTYAARVTALLARILQRHKLKKGTFLNVNVPAVNSAKIRGLKITRQGLIPIHGAFHKRLDPNRREYYWMTGRAPLDQDDDTIDTFALNRNYVTITPIHCDMTDEKMVESMLQWNWKEGRQT